MIFALAANLIKIMNQIIRLVQCIFVCDETAIGASNASDTRLGKIFFQGHPTAMRQVHHGSEHLHDNSGS